MDTPPKKRRFRSMTASHSEKICRIEPLEGKKKISLGHNSSLSINKETPEQKNHLHETKKTGLYLDAKDLIVSICLPKKKKGSAKQRNVMLKGDGIIIADSKNNESFFPLNSFCMIKQDDSATNKSKSPRNSLSSPFVSAMRSSRKEKDTQEIDLRTMLICTQDLTRIWIRFPDRNMCIQWLLCIDGLLGIFYSSSLLNTMNKVRY